MKKICTICNAEVSSNKCRQHLLSHNLHNVFVPDYFRPCGHASQKPHRSWYCDTNKKDDSSITCGAKINGGPFVKIVYNPVGTNRRKY